MSIRRSTGIAILAMAAGCGGSDASGPDSGAGRADAASLGNRAPVIESLHLDPREPAADALLRAVVMARDPDGQKLTLGYRWFVNGAEQGWGEASLPLKGVASKGAHVRVEVTASDGALESEPMESAARVIDRPPSLTQVELVPKGTVAPGQLVTARVGAVDPDGDLIDFLYTWYVNDEPRDESSSLFSTDGLAKGDRIYADVRATDASNWSRVERSPSVTVSSAHPEITSTPPGFREDGEFRYAVRAVDPDGDKRLRFALAKAPTGMAIDDVRGELVWRPAPDQTGVHPVDVVVRDSTGLETTQSFEVTVQQSVASTPANADEGAPRRRR